MTNVIISEGKTTNEAIEKGLKKLNANRDQVEIRVIESEKRSFFDILAPRTIKVEISLKENNDNNHNVIKETNEQDLKTAKENLEVFIREFLNKIDKSFIFEVFIKESNIIVNINGENSGLLIGYRGETLNSLQQILTTIANRNTDSRIRVYLNIDNYKERRKKSLEDLAIKVSKTVIKTNKSIKLEPMNAYERKVIHTKLQDIPNIKTHSIGEDPNRRIIIEKVNK